MKSRRLLRNHAGSVNKRLNYEGKLIALHKHAQQLASATSLDEIIKYTLDAIESPLGVELADFYVVDTEKGCLRLVGLRGWSPSFSELSLRGPGFTVMAANSQQTVRISDINKEEGYVDAAGRSGKAVSTTRLSELAVPVIVEGKTAAVLNVESSQLNAFNDEDQRLLETLAIHVGTTLGHLRQVKELEIMARFPSENPNPILRLDRHGTVLSANEASKALLQDWGSGIGQVAPKPWRDLVIDVLSSREGRNIDIELNGKSYTFLVKPIMEGGYVNLYGRDITERKRIEKTLQESEVRYRTLFDNANDALYFHDGKGRFLDANKVACERLGYSREELLKMSLKDINSPESAALISQRMQEVRERGRNVFEAQEVRRDGSSFPVEVSVRPLSYKGEPAQLGISRDITERKRAEEKLRESEERYHSLFDRMLDGVYLSTHEGRFVDVNPVFVKMFGYSSRQEMLDITDIKKELYFSPGERGSHVLDTGQAEVDVYRMRRKDGSEIWVEDHGGYVHDEQGKIIYHEGIVRDVTDRKRAEEKARAASLYARSLIEASLDPLVTISPDGKIMDVNKATEYITEISRDQLIGSNFSSYFTNPMKAEEGYTEVFAKGFVKDYPLAIRSKSGKVTEVLYNATVYRDENRTIQGVFAAARDITERRHWEQALRRRAQELESLQRTVLEITGHHELTQLLNSIVERAAQLLDATGGGMYLCEPDNHEVRCVVSYNTKINTVGMVLKYGEGAAGIVAQTGKPLIIDDYRVWTGRAAAYETDKPFGAVLSAPMIWQSKVIGVIHVLRYDARRFAEWDLELLIMFANHAAVAVENSRLIAQVQQHSMHLKELVDERTRELRESEEKYRAAKEKLEYVVSSNPATIQLGKPLPDGSDFTPIYLSQSVASLLGFGPEELIGESGSVLWQSRVPPDDLRHYKAQIPLLWRDGHHTFEYRFLHKDGSIRWMHEEDKVIRDSEGQVKDVIGYYTDITERKILEEELRAVRERLEYVVASNPAVLVLEEPLPDLSNTFSTFVSESAKSVFGFEPKNFLGLPGSEFFNSRVPPDDLARYLAEMSSLWSYGHHTFEFRFLHSDGGYRWIREEMKLTRDAEGRILDVVGVCIDLTEQKRLEEKLAKAERLAVIGETAAMVGHDLRNPLQGIAGALHLLKQESLTAEERAEMLQVIEKSVKYSDAIIRDLSDYSAEIKLKLADATPKSITRNAMGAIKVPQNVTVRDLPEDQPTLRADPDMMRRVFINLIQNAIDAMPKGGILTISSQKSDGDVEIVLTDTGSGMPEKVMQNLWKPLQTTKAQGMGLGLAICKRIMDAHEGTISVKSKVGEGTTVTIRLPARPSVMEVALE